MPEKLTNEQAIILTAFTGKMLCASFADFHADVEKRLGRRVMTHEFGSHDMTERIQEAYRADALALIPEPA